MDLYQWNNLTGVQKKDAIDAATDSNDVVFKYALKSNDIRAVLAVARSNCVTEELAVELLSISFFFEFVASTLASNPNTPISILEYLLQHASHDTRRSILKNPSCTAVMKLFNSICL